MREGALMGIPDCPQARKFVGFGSRLCEKSSEPRKRRIIFSICRLPTEVASAIGFRIDETETDVLRAN